MAAGPLPGRIFAAGPHIYIVTRGLRLEWSFQIWNWMSASLFFDAFLDIEESLNFFILKIYEENIPSEHSYNWFFDQLS